MTTTQAITENAAYHAELLASIAELDYAPSALDQQEKYLADLKQQRVKIQKDVERLTKITKKERKEHESLRDSVGKKFMYRIAGKKEKFEAQATKEEKYYFRLYSALARPA
jgi:hypothetical protein